MRENEIISMLGDIRYAMFDILEGEEEWLKIFTNCVKSIIVRLIYTMYHAKDTDILTANASLYIVGDWTSLKDNSKFFNRELLINGPLMSCLEKAVEDEEEMRGWLN